MKSPPGQLGNYLVIAIVAVAVILGMWLLRTNNLLDSDNDSRTTQTHTDRALTDLPGSASSPNATDKFPDPGSQSDAGSEDAQTDEIFESASDYYKPIPLPAEFAGIAENQSSISEFHQKLEREPKDPEWALPLERELEDFLNELLDLSLVAVKLIECRSDSCLILAIGYGEDATKEWLNMSRILYESGILKKWFESQGPGQFNGGCGSVELGPGVAGLLCEFSRTVSQAADEDSATSGPFSLTAPYPDGVDFTPVPVPDDFVSLYETNAEVYDFHRALQAETIDHSWAPFIEDQIAEHFSGIPELESVNYHLIACRMTRCEVQLTISDSSIAVAWTLELKEFQNQPWNDLEFTIYNVPADDDLIRIVWLLQRKYSD